MWDNYDNDNDSSSQIILGRKNKLGWRNSFSDWWWVIEWDFPELHHIIVCEKFVRFAHCLCTSAGWQQQQQHSVHHHPVSRLQERHIIVYIWRIHFSEANSSYEFFFFATKKKKSVWMLFRELKVYMCQIFHQIFMASTIPFFISPLSFLEPVFFLADMRWSKHMCMPKGTYIWLCSNWNFLESLKQFFLESHTHIY